jgi:hypothetical protein
MITKFKTKKLKHQNKINKTVPSLENYALEIACFIVSTTGKGRRFTVLFNSRVCDKSTTTIVFLCNEAFPHVRYSLLFISNNFCDLSLPHWVVGGGGSAVRKIYFTMLSHSPPKAELWA